MLKFNQTSVGPSPIIDNSTTLDDLVAFALTGGLDATSQPDTSGEATANPAVARCSTAYDQAFATARSGHKTEYNAGLIADKAFRRALPPLTGRENIRDFIACVAHGMLLNAINSAEGARLLYAAQIAHTASEPPPSRQPGRPRQQQPDSQNSQPTAS